MCAAISSGVVMDVHGPSHVLGSGPCRKGLVLLTGTSTRASPMRLDNSWSKTWLMHLKAPLHCSLLIKFWRAAAALLAYASESPSATRRGLCAW
jgi:hypothetical protein